MSGLRTKLAFAAFHANVRSIVKRDAARGVMIRLRREGVGTRDHAVYPQGIQGEDGRDRK